MMLNKATKPSKSGVCTKRVDYGDWQTEYGFAKSVCCYLRSCGLAPEVIVEPTCGIGNFIAAAIDVFDSVKKVYGVEISNDYIGQTEAKLQKHLTNGRIANYKLYNANIFSFDFAEIVGENQCKDILVLGNPPWVTNSGLGKTGGDNLPAKSNFSKSKGIDAITGKANFDIAESICNLIIDAFSQHPNTHIALLVKNSVVRSIVYRQHFCPRRIRDIRQLVFDAKKEFRVSVAASLFDCHIGVTCQKKCTVYDFYTRQISHTFGWVGEAFVSNVGDYGRTHFLDGHSPLTWRSGIKHDCAKVMELSLRGSAYYNGLNEVVDVDECTVYPLLKSSDIAKGTKGIRKYLIVPQTNISESTSVLQGKAPKTYAYLMSHAAYLDGRKSVIYKNKPRFSVFGLGDYSFAPYKVVISALYPDLTFSLVEPVAGKPVMVDDTCYLLSFEKLLFAKLTLFILQSEPLECFIRNICFMDAKRVISRDVLMRIDLYQLAKAVDYSSLNVTESEIAEYQNWLYLQTTPSLFGQQMENS